MKKNLQSNNRFTKFVKSFDRFGKPISMTYNNLNTYKTVFGGVLTILSRLAIMIYLTVEVASVLKKDQVQLTITNYQRNLFKDNTTISLDVSNFDVGVHLEYQAIDQTINEEIDQYFSIKYTNAWYQDARDFNYSQALGTTIAHDYPQELERCSSGRFRNDSITVDALKLEGRYWCPKNLQTNLWGHMMGKERTLSMIYITLCDQATLDIQLPGKKCKSVAESMAILPLVEIVIVVMTNYVDANEFEENPIKNNFEVYTSLLSSQSAPVSFNLISQNVAVLHDSLLSNNYDVKNQTYIKMRQHSFFNIDPSLMGFYNAYYFWTDGNVETTKRQVKTIFDVLSGAGGLMNVILLICSVFASKITNALFYIDIIPKIFKIEHTTNKRLNLVRSRESDQIVTANNNNSIDKSPQRNKKLSKLTLSDSLQEIGNDSDRKIIEKGNSSQSKSLSHYINSRKTLRVTFGQWIFLTIQKIFSCVLNKTSKQIYSQRTKIINKGINKIEDSVDIQNLVRAVIDLKILKKLVLSKHQQEIINHCKEFVLGCNSDNDNVTPQQKKKSIDEIVRKATRTTKKAKDENEYYNLLGIDKSLINGSHINGLTSKRLQKQQQQFENCLQYQDDMISPVTLVKQKTKSKHKKVKLSKPKSQYEVIDSISIQKDQQRKIPK